MNRAQNFRYLIGLSLEEAQSVNSNLRVVDANTSSDTAKDETRLNITVENGIVKQIHDFY